MPVNDILTSSYIATNSVSLSLNRLTEFVLLNEAKQVGILYHFTKLENIEKIVKGTDISKSFEVASFNGYFSMTRDKTLPINFGPIGGKIKDISTHNGYLVRITLDGNKLSEKYKITPVAGFTDSHSDPIKDKGLRIKRNSPETEAEEVIDLKNNFLDIKPYVLKIDILNTKESEGKFSKISELCKAHSVPCHLVKKFV